MNVRIAKQCAANTLCVPTPSAASCAHADQNTQETHEWRAAAVTSTSAKRLIIPAAPMLSARTRRQDTIASVHKVIEPIQIHKLLANR